jgi:DNA repair exonuclease SbcCD nuclease subunit
MKLLQFSDLHLSASNDQDYCLGVLDEIVSRARELKCDALLLCGDIFDTYADLVALRTKFLDQLKSFEGKVFFLPGNHESLRRQGKEKSFQIFDWGKQIHFLEEGPYSIHILGEEVELLAIPHRESYGDLLLSLPPQKSAKIRIALAHATIVGMSFTGLKDEEDEEKGGYIDLSQLQALGCDYVAVGHIHSARSQKFGNMEVAYAGSSRVWRIGETGSRGGILLEIVNGAIRKTGITFHSAGEFSEVLIQLGLDGRPEKSAEEYLGNFTKYDWVRIKWFGIVESMSGKIEFQKQLEVEWKGRLRKLEFDSDESDLIVAENLSENAFIQHFLQVMEGKRSLMDPLEWIRTKELGLKLLLEVAK